MGKKKSNLLIEREFCIDSEAANGGRLTWYTPTEHIKEKYPSVLDTEFTQTSSSAGDWNGLIVQRQGGGVAVIPFSQENHWYSFVLNTGKKITSFPFRGWKAAFSSFKEEYLKSLNC